MNNTALKKLLINLIGCFGIFVCSSYLQAASFDCTKAVTNTEKNICADEGLSALDSQLATVYKKGMDVAIDKVSFKKEQLAWLKTRNSCKDITCLSQSYQSRIATLGDTSSANPATGTPKKFIAFTLLEGEGYPLCKEYVDMLNKTKYTEIPSCSRKILPAFKNFQEIKWVEITDKEEMIKIIKERMAVQQALNPNNSKQLYAPENRIKLIAENRLKMYFYKIKISDDGVADTVYRNEVNPIYKIKYGHCQTVNKFYIDDSKITIESIRPFFYDPYRSFNISGSNELFIYGGNLYVSIYGGLVYRQTNLDVYSVGNKKICGIVAK